MRDNYHNRLDWTPDDASFLFPSNTFEPPQPWQPESDETENAGPTLEKLAQWDAEIEATIEAQGHPKSFGLQSWNGALIVDGRRYNLFKRIDSLYAPYFFEFGRHEVPTGTGDYAEALSRAIDFIRTETETEGNQH